MDTLSEYIVFYKHTHRAEVIANPRLYSLIKITHEERLSNFMIILSQQAIEVSTIPKNSDALDAVRNNDLPGNNASTLLEVGQACVTLWNDNGT